MHIYGYEKTARPIDTIIPASLAEITLSATPEELRAIAEFLLHCAGEMDGMGQEFSHIHLSDRKREFESSPHFVVVRA